MRGHRIVWACMGAPPVDDRGGPLSATDVEQRGEGGPPRNIADGYPQRAGGSPAPSPACHGELRCRIDSSMRRRSTQLILVAATSSLQTADAIVPLQTVGQVVARVFNVDDAAMAGRGRFR